MIFKSLNFLRWISLVAIICSIAASVLMFIIGAKDTFKAFKGYFYPHNIDPADVGIKATIKLVGALDSFIFGLVLFYFAFAIYHLFIKPVERHKEEDKHAMQIPNWLLVGSLGELKKTLLEVIIVIIAVLFLKELLNIPSVEDLNWELLTIPAAMVALAIVIKLVNFDHH